MNPNSVISLDLEDSNPFFAHNTLAYNAVLYHQSGFGYKKV